MTESELFHPLTLGLALLSLPTFAILWWVRAPYGRYARPGWGPSLPSRWGWIAMETPSVVLFAFAFWTGRAHAEPVPLALASLWLLHYVHRAWIYPWRARLLGRRMPVAVVGMAMAFNILNATLNARALSQWGDYPLAWLSDARCVIGIAVMLTGMAVNVWADTQLMALRRDAAGHYRVPRGGLFEWVSCPNYLGEIVIWIGWALATWSGPGAAFALYTAANLVPRARSHHRWYQENFPDYPARRRALVPGLW